MPRRDAAPAPPPVPLRASTMIHAPPATVARLRAIRARLPGGPPYWRIIEDALDRAGL